MSGGFFRGTSADQDTRFSNKQAKLLKSQKFAPELDHLVDMTKVKMDVIRPWIATRATELLGFEDEVLINFIYGLLDGKVVDGKKIQIQLTGFMEKNTGKFMKELWILLLSAQNNLSGVPQQFLDAKEEEQRKKKEENERISQEIQKRKERTGRELEREKLARMDAEDIDLKPHKTGPDLVSRPRASNGQLEEERKEDENYTLKRDGHFMSPHRSNPLPISQRSSSASRSSSREGHKSRSASMCSQSPRHSISPKKRSHSPIRRSPTHIRHYRSPHRRLNSRSPIRRSPLASRSPIRRSSVASQSPIRKRSPRTFGSPIRRSPRTSRSPIRRRSPHSRRRSISRSRDRYPSPYYRRSNARRRSPYLHHRSPSPLCRRSPSSPSPVRCRSPPVRRRSPLPLHRRSRSPRRRSPIHLRRRSPSPFRHRSPARHVSPSPPRYESLSPVRKRSPLTKSSRHKKQSPSQSPIRQHTNSRRSLRQRSPSPRKSVSPSIHRSFHNEHNNFAGKNVSGRPCDERAQRTLSAHNNKVKEIVNIVGSDKPPNHFTSMTVKRISSRKRSRSISRSRSPVVQIGGSLSRHEISDANKEEKRSPHARDVAHHKNDVSHKRNAYLSTNFENSYKNDHTLNELFPDRTAQFPSTQHVVKSEIKLNDTGDRQRKNSQQALKLQEDVEYGPGGTRGGRDCSEDVKMLSQDKSPERRRSKEYEMHGDARYVAHKVQSISKDTEYEEAPYVREHGKRSKKKLDKDYHLISNYSESDDAQDIEKQQHKRLDSYKQKFSESSEDDSPVEDKKDAKRKKKEERRLRKEERRKMREERRRRRSERRAVRQKVKSMDALSTPSDIEKLRSDSGDSDGTSFKRKHSHTSIDKETESEQKRLEFELRKRALESLRAKKAIND